jgi:hypothetical protein
MGDLVALRNRLSLLAAVLVLAAGLAFAGVELVTRAGAGRSGPATGAPASAGDGGASTAAAAPVSSASTTARHYVSNTGAARARAAALGFNLVDLGPDKAIIDALPHGQQALVWLGNLDNTSCTPGYSWARFTAAVDRLAGDRKVFGYYLSDEPHPSVCPDAVTHIRQRADYIRSLDPGQLSFIVVLDSGAQCGTVPGCEYAALRPESSHVDLFGIDPFVCNVSTGCNLERIRNTAALAEQKGIPRAAMVPVYQAFGQACATQQGHYYALPTAEQMRQMFTSWSGAVPHPVFDFAYTWRSEGPACPALDRADGSAGTGDLQSLFREHNQG